MDKEREKSIFFISNMPMTDAALVQQVTIHKLIFPSGTENIDSIPC